MRLHSKCLVCFWALSLAGCSTPDPIGNREIIATTRYCEAEGFRPAPVFNAWSGRVIAIQCMPKGFSGRGAYFTDGIKK